jgi:hypothetical protein
MLIPDPDLHFLSIPNLGSRAQGSKKHRIRIRNTGWYSIFKIMGFCMRDFGLPILALGEPLCSLTVLPLDFCTVSATNGQIGSLTVFYIYLFVYLFYLFIYLFIYLLSRSEDV